MPGFVVPFMLVLTSNALEFFQSDSIFNEGSNWQGKVEFSYLGTSLFTNFLPSLSSYLPISHNFILDFYLRLGYLLLTPLILFLFEYINITISNNRCIDIVVIIFIITVSLVSPLALFYHSGAVWAVVILGAAYHTKLTGSKFNEE